jgi:hypothetical protein
VSSRFARARAERLVQQRGDVGQPARRLDRVRAVRRAATGTSGLGGPGSPARQCRRARGGVTYIKALHLDVGDAAAVDVRAGHLLNCGASTPQSRFGWRTLKTPPGRGHDAWTSAHSQPTRRSGYLGSRVRPEAASAPRSPHESRHQLGGAPGSCSRGRPWCQRPRRQRRWDCPRHVTILVAHRLLSSASGPPRQTSLPTSRPQCSSAASWREAASAG